MSEEQVTAGHERLRNSADQALRIFRGEIHQHVAAEDDVITVRSPQPGVVHCQIALFEVNRAADRFIEQVVATRGAKPATLHRRGCFAQCPGGIARTPGLVDDCRVDVHAGNVDVPGRGIRCLAQKNGERISLFAGGAACRENFQLPLCCLRTQASGQHHVGEGTKLLVVTEKIGFRNCEFLSQRVPLRRRVFTFEPFQIQLAGAAAVLQARMQHFSQKIALTFIEVQTQTALDCGAETVDIVGMDDHRHAGPSQVSIACHAVSGTMRAALRTKSSSASSVAIDATKS